MVTTDFCGPDETLADINDCLSDLVEVIPKLVGVKFRELPVIIKCSLFAPG